MTLSRISSSFLFKTCLVLSCAVVWSAQVFAQNSPIIIRDTEIEKTLDEWSTPILKAAGLDLGNVNVILVQSPQLNAFVAGGANIFLYTGLIERTDSPGELIGVYAHELGHITGGHLIKAGNALERASYESILGAVLGIGAAIATGNGAAASAIISGSSNIAARNYLSHSRIHESSADQAALTFFEKSQMNPKGLATFLQKLEDEELIPASQQSEYVRTHPITARRVEAAIARGNKSPFINKDFPPEWLEMHRRMKAKLLGFIDPGRVPWAYSDQDKSIAARYARAIAAYRQNNVDHAVSGIDSLIKDEPNNPYFHELKGQMLIDFARLDEAVPSYKRAVDIMPDAPLIRIAYSHALIEQQGGDDNLNLAIKNLERALADEKRNGRAYRLLATAHGRLGREDVAKVYLAEEAVLQGRYDYAKRQAEAALQTLDKGSKEAIQAQDIVSYVENNKDIKN